MYRCVPRNALVHETKGRLFSVYILEWNEELRLLHSLLLIKRSEHNWMRHSAENRCGNWVIAGNQDWKEQRSSQRGRGAVRKVRQWCLQSRVQKVLGMQNNKSMVDWALQRADSKTVENMQSTWLGGSQCGSKCWFKPELVTQSIPWISNSVLLGHIFTSVCSLVVLLLLKWLQATPAVGNWW